jgi:hypothetical protein
MPALSGWAIWNGAGNVFGPDQGAAFTFANTPINNSWLILKASGGSATTPANYIRVVYSGGNVTIATTNNGNTATPDYVTRATFAATFVNGDRITAAADAGGNVYLWKTTAANVTTFIGTTSIPASGTNGWPQATGGGRIGILLPGNARVDDFRGGNVVIPAP